MRYTSQTRLVAAAITQTLLESNWGPLGCPAVMLYGPDDRVGRGQGAEYLHRALRRSNLVYMQAAGHFVITEQAERFAAEVVRWVKESGL